MNKIDRREALQRVAVLMGGTISAPLLVGLLEGCQTKTKPADATTAQALFTENHHQMIAEIAEIIVPTTDTPGAKAAKVPEFIHVMLTDCYPEKEQKAFFAGLDALDASAQKANGKNFVSSTADQQIALLKQAESDAVAQREKEAKNNKNKPQEDHTSMPLFFPMMKELTLVGYFTSEIGCTQALEYTPVPGRYEGCVPMKAGQKGWAT